MAASSNGVYVVTSLGRGSSPWVLTRADDADDQNLEAGLVYVLAGTSHANTLWECVADVPVVVGVSDLPFSKGVTF